MKRAFGKWKNNKYCVLLTELSIIAILLESLIRKSL
jgi:hypothetical protein